MIRILHVVHTMECGGIETMLMNIYRLIDRSKIQFDFLVNGTTTNYYTAEILELGGIVYAVTPKRENFSKNLREMTNVMKQNNYQIVHIHQDSMISPAIMCAKKSKVKHIFTHAHTTSAPGFQRKLLTIMSRNYICKNAEVKLACSEAAANWIYGKHEKKYILFKNAIDSKKFKYDSEMCANAKMKLGLNKKFVIGTCGRLSTEKNQKFLLEIFKKIKLVKSNSVLILIGDGDEKEELIQYAKKLSVFESVMFIGMVANVEYYYSALDCFVLPSYYEGLPLAGIEAQAAGLPCFFSTGVTREIKITPSVYFLDITDGPQKWADEIICCAAEKENTMQLIKKAGYDISSNVISLQKLYFNVVIRKGDQLI